MKRGQCVDRLRAALRRELLILAMGVMDVCIVTPLLAALLSLLVPVRPFRLAAVFLVAVVAAQYIARVVLRLSVGRAARTALVLTMIVVSGLVVIQRLFYASSGLLNPAWLVAVFREMRRANLEWSNVSKDALIFGFVLFLWWRGILLARRRHGSVSVSFRFRLGIVILAFTMLLGGLVLDWAFEAFAYVYFFASLFAIALARSGDVGERYGISQVPFNLTWLVTWIGVSLTVLFAAAGLAALLTGENISSVLAPVWTIIRGMLLGVAWLLGWVAEAVVLLLRLIVGDIDLERFREMLSVLRLSRPALPNVGQPQSGEEIALVRTLRTAASLLALVVVVALSLRWLRKQRKQGLREDVESVWDPAMVGAGLQELWRGARNWLADATSGFQWTRVWAALTIRRIYAQMAALASERGYPRARHQTPFEYLQVLAKVFPELRGDLACITDSYVAAHYGEIPESEEELDRVQAAWRRVFEALG